jgi:hypothetical protein
MMVMEVGNYRGGEGRYFRKNLWRDAWIMGEWEIGIKCCLRKLTTIIKIKVLPKAVPKTNRKDPHRLLVLKISIPTKPSQIICK